MVSDEKIAQVRDRFNNALRQSSQHAEGLHVRVLDDEPASVANHLAWSQGMFALSLQLRSSNGHHITTLGREVAHAGGLSVDDRGAFHLGMRIIAPEAGTKTNAPIAPGARQVPVGLAADGSLRLITLGRAEIDASEIVQAANGLGSDYKAAASLFVWGTGLTSLRAITPQNLRIYGSLLRRLPSSIGKSARHWELHVETAITSISPAGRRLSEERCARHVRNVSKLRVSQETTSNLDPFLHRIVPQTQTVTLSDEERRLFPADKCFTRYVVFVTQGRICSARWLPVPHDNPFKVETDLGDTDTAILVDMLKVHIAQRMVGGLDFPARYGTSFHQFAVAATHWLFADGCCIICSKQENVLSDFIFLDSILSDARFTALKRWAVNLRRGSAPEQRFRF